MLALADGFLDLLHIAVIVFNLTGWIWPKTRVAHRCLVALTTFFWLVVGPMVHSLGYCPLTQLQYAVKYARGIKDMPNSYIDYLLQKVGIHLDPQLIDVMTGVTFASALVVTLVVWRRERRYAKAVKP